MPVKQIEASLIRNHVLLFSKFPWFRRHPDRGSISLGEQLIDLYKKTACDTARSHPLRDYKVPVIDGEPVPLFGNQAEIIHAVLTTIQEQVARVQIREMPTGRSEYYGSQKPDLNHVSKHLCLDLSWDHMHRVDENFIDTPELLGYPINGCAMPAQSKGLLSRHFNSGKTAAHLRSHPKVPS